jgi:glc operon protein GlcG
MPNSLLELSQRVARAAREKAAEMGIPISVAVVDAGGRTVLIEREDEAGFLTPETALSKAVAAAAYRVDTARLEERIANSNFWKFAPTVLGGTVLPTKGGLPLYESGKLVGAIGVTGGSGLEDYEIVKAAVGFLVSE